MFRFLRRMFRESADMGRKEAEEELANSKKFVDVVVLATILGKDGQEKVIEKMRTLRPSFAEMATGCVMAKVADLNLVFDYLYGQVKDSQDLKDWLLLALTFKDSDERLHNEALKKAASLAISYKDWKGIYELANRGSEVEKQAFAKMVELVPKDDPDKLASLYGVLYKEDPNDPRLGQLKSDLLAWMGIHAKAGQWYALLKKAPQGSPLEDAALEGYKASDRS